AILQPLTFVLEPTSREHTRRFRALSSHILRPRPRNSRLDDPAPELCVTGTKRR
ncbi:hypothetical protein P7K49_036174, partial [Saguinus oedipus]